MNILLTFDDGYCKHAAATIASLTYNNPGAHHFFIVADKLSDEHLAALRQCAPKCQIDFIRIDISKFKQLPIGKGTANQYISIAAYFRLLALDLLPKDLDRILYLDCDIIVNGNLEVFYLSEFKSSVCLLALEENPLLAKSCCERLGYDNAYSYFNSGVLLLNLPEIYRAYNYQKALDFADCHQLLYHDQDILNGLFHDRKDFFELKYNVLDSFLIKGFNLPERYLTQKKDLYHPVIIHFSGPLKPWYTECRHPFRSLYYKYLRMTPWKDAKPTPKYTTLKEKMIFQTKRLVKNVLDTLHLRPYRFISISQ